MAYNGIDLKDTITLDKIYSIHYFEYMSDFTFKGESHNFWEFVCVDKGEVAITAADKFIILKKGHIAFHQPNEFHNVKATGKIAPNLVVISFGCQSKAMNFFQKQVLQIDETERNLLANIIIEARNCLEGRLDDPYMQTILLKKAHVFGSQQLIRLYIEQFLLHLIRRYRNVLVMHKNLSHPDLAKITKSNSDYKVYNRIVSYLEINISKNITIENICQDILVSRSQLQKIFKDITSMGVIEYLSHMRINLAKEMIRTNQLNFTQISEQLGYSSIHYFSRRFRKITGMTPTDYASSIKAMADSGFNTVER